MHSIDPFFQKGEGKERYEAFLTCFIRERYMKVLPYRTYAEVNLQQLKENTRKVRALLSKDTKLLAVLKADGYGHGAVRIAKAIEDMSDWFAVASFYEAIELRDQGITIPILVFGFLDDSNIEEAVQKNITCSALSYSYALHIAELCEQKRLRLSMHIKLDTGFHRLGIACEEERIAEAYKEVRTLYELPQLQITGIYTHFSTAGSKALQDEAFLARQYRLFCDMLHRLEEDQIDPGIRHCCNSKATLTNPEMHLDMVRVGLYLYGLGSDADIEYLKLEPIVNWKARIYAIRDVKQGEGIGYSRTFITPKPMRIAVVSLGFADGYSRCLYASDQVYVLVHGRRTRILGKICMDVMMIDITDIPDVRVNDTVTVLGSEGTQRISANLLGRETGGTAVEVTCGMGKRVQRVYVHDEGNC